MPAARSPHSEPLPGYRLLELLGRGGFGEVWKCEAPGGLFKAIKFVGASHPLGGAGGAEREWRALQMIKTIRHPFLLSTERIEQIDDDLIIVMELADKSLHDLLQEHRRAGRAGLPRRELLGYLREAAEVLDLMNQEYGLKHLDVKPRNLFLVGRHIKVADFGQVNRLAEVTDDGQSRLGGVTPLYAAPELFLDQVTLFTDQYSLAVSYQELLTSVLPFSGVTIHQLALQVTTQPPDLSPLPEADRPILARALAREPRDRFPSCLDFIEALKDASPAPDLETTPGFTLAGRTTSCQVRLPDPARTTRLPIAHLTPGPMPFPPPSTTAVRPGKSEGPLAGYELLECLGRSPAGEVWRAIGPDRKPRQVRFFPPPDEGGASGAAPTLGRLSAMRHRCLASLAVIQTGPERVALASEAGEGNLAARFKECQVHGLPGIPRAELVNFVARIACALADLYERYQLQHLCLTPRAIALTRGDPILLDFGLAELIWMPAGLQPAALNPRYAAVELFGALPSDRADQYSLALIYQELLVGLHPFRHKNARQLATPRLRGDPDLGMIPAPDRLVLQRALQADPPRRFASCREFALALEEAARERTTVAVSAEPTQAVPGPPTASRSRTMLPTWQPLVQELFAVAARGQEVRTSETLHYRFEPRKIIDHHARARLVPGTALLRLESFAEQWDVEQWGRTGTTHRFVVRTPGNLLERVLGWSPGVEVEVRLKPASEGSLTPIRVLIRPIDCAGGRAAALLEELGPVLLNSLQTYLNTQCDREGQEWYPLPAGVEVIPTSRGQEAPRSAVACSIGRHGLTLELACPVRSDLLRVRLPRGPGRDPVEVPLRVLSCQEIESGRYEVEGRFGS
jgi:serine/threonine protein kinase